MPQRKLSRWINSIGPGLIVAALVFGPSKLTITSKIGANFRYDLLWIIIIAIFFMAVYTVIAERIGLASDRSLLSLIGEKWGRGVAKIVGFGIFLVCASFQTGNSVGVGIAIGELTHTNTIYWIILFNVIGILLLFFRSFYKILEKVMLGLVILMLIAFLITLFEVKPNISEVAKGFFVPKFPEGSAGLIVAFMASCFSIVGAFYTSYLVQERKKISPSESVSQSSSLTGIIILGLLSAIVMISAGTILYPMGIDVKTAKDMSIALKPAFGDYASAVFLIGLFAAGFSSIIGNASIGGTLLSDALGYGSNFNSYATRLIIALVMIIGGIIAIIFGGAPLELIVFAQSITIFIVPIIGYALFFISNDKEYMREFVSTPFLKISGAFGLLIIIILAIVNFIDIFLK
ncbi:MAG: Nramp family divalent metal transporter [Fermentimonas sp.]|jgi:manganese transport protein